MQPQTPPDRLPTDPHTQIDALPSPPTTTEPILCPHCLRTATNGIKCKGICVADSDY